MNTQNLADALRAWEPLVSAGYSLPAAGSVMYQAAHRLEYLERIITNLFDCGIEDWDSASDETVQKHEEYINQ